MEADYLIAYSHGETAGILARGLLDAGYSVAMISPDSVKNKKQFALHVKWNPKSPLSAKNALLSIENTFTSLPVPVIVFPDIDEIGSATHKTGYASIESIVDYAVRGMIFLIKETIAACTDSEQKIILCLPRKPLTENALTASLYDYMQVLGEKLFSEYRNTGITLFGFHNREDDTGQFSAYLLQQLPRLHRKMEYRWNISSEKGSFFSNIRK